MKHLILNRRYTSKGTIGSITLGNIMTENNNTRKVLTTLEPPNLNNRKNESCIPEGEYTIHRDNTGRHRWWRFEKVKGRTNIEIHEGLNPQDSAGCIIMSIEDLQSLLIWTDNQSFNLTIKEEL